MKKKALVVVSFLTLTFGLVSLTPAFAKPPKVPEPTVSSPKKTIAVSNFQNKAGIYCQINLGEGMADMLADALMKSGRFIVLERQALGSVVAEQNLAASGRASAGTAAATGDIKRTQILVEGAVTEYEDNSAGGGQGVGFYGVNVGMKRSKAHLAVILRLIDTTTSEVLLSQRVEGKASKGGLSVGFSGYGINAGQSGYSSTPIGKAMQQIVDEAVVLVANTLEPLPWAGKVIKVENDTVFINAGSQAGIAEGAILDVFRQGERLKDPDTGLDLGGEDAYLGKFRVDEVHDKFSKGKSLDQPLVAGDIVKSGTSEVTAASSQKES